MNSSLLEALVAIAESPNPGAYVESQDASLACARRDYRELRSIVASHSDAAIRLEALSLVELLGEPDAESVLLSSSESDPHPGVAEHARSLLFRASLAKTLRGGGDMSPEQFRTYRGATRRLAAEKLFQPPSQAPDSAESGT